MARIINLDSESHTYTVDGEIVPSVSEVTRFISREIYGEISQYTLENAAARGTKVHKATEALDKYGDAEVDEDLAPYLEAYVAFRREHKVTWEKIEYACHSEKLNLCGTADRIGIVDGKNTLLDIKTSSSLQKVLYGAQLNLYRLILLDNGIEVERLIIAHLKKDGSYKLVEMPIDETVARACLALHNALHKKPRKGKKTE